MGFINTSSAEIVSLLPDSIGGKTELQHIQPGGAARVIGVGVFLQLSSKPDRWHSHFATPLASGVRIGSNDFIKKGKYFDCKKCGLELRGT